VPVGVPRLLPTSAWVFQSIPLACGGTLYQFPLLSNLQRKVLCQAVFLLVLGLRHRSTELELLPPGTINSLVPTLNLLREANGLDILLIIPANKTCRIPLRPPDTLTPCPLEAPLVFNQAGTNMGADERFRNV